MGVNGTNPFGGPCPTDTYCCDCKDANFKPKPCHATVGYENVYEQFGKFIGHRGCHRTILKPFPSVPECYTQNIVTKLSPTDHGTWYSSLAGGYCADASSACTWRVVSVDKIVQRQCHIRVFGGIVQAAGDASCLDGCADQRTNTSSPCWVDCFYKAALGPEADKPGGAVAGLSVDALKAAWLKPFAAEADGGCPAQPEYRVSG